MTSNSDRSRTGSDDEVRLAPPERQAQLDEMYQMLTAIGLAATREEQRKSLAVTAEKAIPLTLLGGFLGAGKTTVLNELLSGDHGLRLGVIVNDFGSVNIDASLIRAEDNEMVTMENGCVCCSSSGQLGDALDRMTGLVDVPDAIVIEASGVADPQSVAYVAMTNPRVKLDGVVTVVDSETLLERASDAHLGDLVTRQILAADVVLLNKTDLVTDGRRSEVREWIRTHASEARIVEGEYGEVPTAVVLGVGESRLEAQADTDEQPGHRHDEQLDTWTFSSRIPLDRTSFLRVIETLPETVIRAKGILQTTDDPERRVIFQLVGKRWDFTQGEGWADQTPQSNLVLIGLPGSLPEQLRARFDDCLARSTRADTDPILAEF
jgi:G3E family GTPase